MSGRWPRSSQARCSASTPPPPARGRAQRRAASCRRACHQGGIGVPSTQAGQRRPRRARRSSEGEKKTTKTARLVRSAMAGPGGAPATGRRCRHESPSTTPIGRRGRLSERSLGGARSTAVEDRSRPGATWRSSARGGAAVADGIVQGHRMARDGKLAGRGARSRRERDASRRRQRSSTTASSRRRPRASGRCAVAARR